MKATINLLASASLCTALFALSASTGADAKPRFLPRVLGVHGLVKNIRAHQKALQMIADQNNGTRASGTPGYEDTAAYVKRRLMRAGFTVTEQPFTFPLFEELSDPVFEQTAPAAITYVHGDEFSTMQYSGSGDVTAPVGLAGGIVLPPTPDPSSTSGCDPADFSGFASGNVALIQRGGCTFEQKAQNAAAAGASAVIIFNEGNPGRTDAFGGTLVNPQPIPVLSVSFAVGEALVNAVSPATNLPVVHVKTDTRTTTQTTKNLIADLPGGRPDRVIVVGAHLDSVAEGPGINDNGSGSSMILELALRMKKMHLHTRNKLRFAWWGAEEEGLLGSTHYVGNLTPTELANIAMNLNFDMVASPNYVRMVYDGDGSATPDDPDDAGPDGSAEIEEVFNTWFGWRRLAVEPTAFDGRSDYGPFIEQGIPAGGLFTGAEAIKTAEQAAVFGGTAGEPLDACYHQACDTYDNNNETVLRQMTEAAGVTMTYFAFKPLPARPAETARVAAARGKTLFRGNLLQR